MVDLTSYKITCDVYKFCLKFIEYIIINKRLKDIPKALRYFRLRCLGQESFRIQKKKNFQYDC